MGQYSIGDALSLLMERSAWKPKIVALRIRDEWETITSKTIARYTKAVNMNGKILTIHTDVAALKQELQFGKEQLISNINNYFGERVVEDIIIR